MMHLLERFVIGTLMQLLHFVIFAIHFETNNLLEPPLTSLKHPSNSTSNRKSNLPTLLNLLGCCLGLLGPLCRSWEVSWTLLGACLEALESSPGRSGELLDGLGNSVGETLMVWSLIMSEAIRAQAGLHRVWASMRSPYGGGLRAKLTNWIWAS